MFAVLSVVLLLGTASEGVPQGLMTFLIDPAMSLTGFQNSLDSYDRDAAAQAGIELFLTLSNITTSFDPRYVEEGKQLLIGLQKFLKEVDTPIETFGAEIKGKLDHPMTFLISLDKLSKSVEGPADTFFKTTVPRALNLLLALFDDKSSFLNGSQFSKKPFVTFQTILKNNGYTQSAGVSPARRTGNYS